MTVKNDFFAVLITLLLVLPTMALSASAPKKPVTAAELALYNGADRQQLLEQGAKKEGRLLIYSTQTEKQITDAFQKKYPYIKMEIWRDDDTRVASRILEEYKAGLHAVDVLSFTGFGSVIMSDAGILQPFISPNIPFLEDYAINASSGGAVLTAGHYQSGIGLGYNTKLVTRAQLPKTYADLLDPKWMGKGKVGIVGSSTGVTWMGGMLHAYGEDFVEKIAKQNFDVHMVSARALLDLVTNGEYVFSPTIMDSHIGKSKQMGAPVDWVPLEPVASYLGQIMMTKYSPNPHAALLCLDFILSREAGELYKATGYNSPRKDLPGDRPYKKYFGPESAEQARKWMAAFNKNFLKR